MIHGHLGSVWVLTLAQILLHNTTTNKATVDVLYIPSDAPERWFVGNANGTSRELFLSDNYVKSKDETATIAHTVDANGKLTSEVKISAEEGNTLSANLDGLFVNVPNAFLRSITDTATIGLVETAGALTANVKISADANNTVVANVDGIYAADFAIHADSSTFLEKIGREIRVKQLLIKDVKTVTAIEVTTAGSVATWLTDNEGGYQEGDMAMIPSEGLAYVRSETGWEQVKMPNMTQAQILAFLSAGAFITIGTDGVIAVKVSTDAGNDIKAGAVDGGLFVDVDQTLTSAGPGNLSINTHIQNLYNGVAEANKSYANGLSNPGTGEVVGLGGPLLRNTDIATGAYNLNIDGTLKTNGLQVADQFGVYFPVKLDSIRRVVYIEFPN